MMQMHRTRRRANPDRTPGAPRYISEVVEMKQTDKQDLRRALDRARAHIAANEYAAAAACIEWAAAGVAAKRGPLHY